MQIESSLKGKRVLVTRASVPQTENELTLRLKASGAHVTEKPLLCIGPPSSFNDLDQALSGLDSFEWIVFASPRAVSATIERLRYLFNIHEEQINQSVFKSAKIAAVGKSTAQFLAESGIKIDFHPSDYCASSLVSQFPQTDLKNKKIFWPRTLAGDTTIYDGLKARNAEVFMAEAYSSNLPSIQPDFVNELRQLMNSELDAITFTSSQTVRNFVSLFEQEKNTQRLSDLFANVAVAAIGPKTAKTAEEIYGRVDVVAGEYTIEGLIKSLECYFQNS